MYDINIFFLIIQKISKNLSIIEVEKQSTDNKYKIYVF